MDILKCLLVAQNVYWMFKLISLCLTEILKEKLQILFYVMKLEKEGLSLREPK